MVAKDVGESIEEAVSGHPGLLGDDGKLRSVAAVFSWASGEEE